MSTLRSLTATRLHLLLVLSAILLVLGIPLLQAQDNDLAAPTAVAQATTDPTIDAAVATFFAQTQQASGADMTAAIATAFSAAQTATAQGGAASREEAPAVVTSEVTAESTLDVSTLSAEVVDTFELPAGPANTSAYLSPDGEQFVYVDNLQICLYTVDGTEQHCTPLGEDNQRMDRESVTWSLDGRYVAFALQAFVFFLDSDIWVYDTVENTLINVTPDETLELDLAELDGTELTIDLSPRWTDDGRLWYIHVTSQNTGSVMSTNLSGDDVSEVHSFTTEAAFQYYLMDVRSDSSAFALAGYVQGDEGQSIYYQNDAEDISRNLSLPDEFGPLMLTFSPDGQYLLLLNGIALGELQMQEGAMSVLDVTTSELTPVDSERLTTAAGWLPGQNSLIYSVFDFETDSVGLYICPTPGEPGEPILTGRRYFPTSTRNAQPFRISSQNTFLASQEGDFYLNLIALQ